MKSIFTKLSVLILCGAFAVVGCTDFSADLKDFNDRLTANENATATNAKGIGDLKAEIQTLVSSIASTYATKAELTAVSTELGNLDRKSVV